MTRMLKFKKLKASLKSMGSVLVAFSGGVDSTLLLKTAADALGSRRVLAVCAVSAVMPAEEQTQAKTLARAIGVRLKIVRGREMHQPRFLKNDKRRCYWCKRDRFRSLLAIARREGIRQVIEGSTIDDLGDYRPGMKAVQELGIRSPLLESGLDKADIRALSRRLGLPTWDKPAAACLATRIPYGTRIEAAQLKHIDAAEKLIRRAGFSQVRVRHHGDMARIEVPRAEISHILTDKVRSRIAHGLRRLGWVYVAVDLEGYSTGKLNLCIARK